MYVTTVKIAWDVQYAKSAQLTHAQLSLPLFDHQVSPA